MDWLAPYRSGALIGEVLALLWVWRGEVLIYRD